VSLKRKLRPASNGKGFWQTVNQLQGKVKKETAYVEINGNKISDDQLRADGFANFFEEKILNLTSSLPPIRSIEREESRPTHFTSAELETSLKFFKTKMSSGPDGIPMRLVKFYAQKRPLVVLDIFNKILDTSFPESWRLARVTPVPKKGDLTALKNYRPVSNLASMSKLFERCILHRLMNLPTFAGLLGDHQHGFRAGRSTTTCLLSLKDNICENLDSKNKVIAYSLDLSAAFDMLRPDTFMDLMKGKIPDDLLGILGEFLCERKFYVEINGKKSPVKAIDRGCPQGSVLGPVLFNLYTGVISNKIPSEAVLTSYADDSYVVIHDDDQGRLVGKVEACLTTHIEALEEIGMKVNEEKTEIVLFGKNNPPVTLNVKGTAVESKASIKALGIVIDKGLSWSDHVSALKSCKSHRWYQSDQEKIDKKGGY